ncbi:hypothetical protein TNCV_3612181 [Trichonephila clavipes]|nr:hypothetical protein TNCV_3612181 [Trichonephila clavipes]
MHEKSIDAQTFSSWCGVEVRRVVPPHVSSSSLDRGSKLRGSSPINLFQSKELLPFKYEATRGLLVTDHVILNHGQVTWTTPELAPPSPNYHTTPTGGRFSSQQI